MFHNIEFTADTLIDIESFGLYRLEQVRIRKGSRLMAQTKPYVVFTREGAREVADLYFADGTIARVVPFECFAYLDQ